MLRRLHKSICLLKIAILRWRSPHFFSNPRKTHEDFRRNCTRQGDRRFTPLFVAPRTGIPDDLPMTDLEQAIPGLHRPNPTSHLGNTRSRPWKKSHFHLLGGLSFFPLDTFRLNRFSEEDVTPIY